MLKPFPRSSVWLERSSCNIGLRPKPVIRGPIRFHTELDERTESAESFTNYPRRLNIRGGVLRRDTPFPSLDKRAN